mmetsp:Transcript_47322/g.86932  ORF Transcript_47322/g.86932 Transcript_47322/m.86932 type:complete len:275 (-) Transcript_47322:589-1413(-)
MKPKPTLSPTSIIAWGLSISTGQTHEQRAAALFLNASRLYHAPQTIAAYFANSSDTPTRSIMITVHMLKPSIRYCPCGFEVIAILVAETTMEPKTSNSPAVKEESAAPLNANWVIRSKRMRTELKCLQEHKTKIATNTDNATPCPASKALSPGLSTCVRWIVRLCSMKVKVVFPGARSRCRSNSAFSAFRTNKDKAKIKKDSITVHVAQQYAQQGRPRAPTGSSPSASSLPLNSTFKLPTVYQVNTANAMNVMTKRDVQRNMSDPLGSGFHWLS